MDVGGMPISGIGCAILPVLLITYFLFHIIRPFWKVTVNCWFCNENVCVAYRNRKAFICPKCGQYNGFKEDGDYDRFIPEQKYEFLNPTPKKTINGIKKSSIYDSNAANGLCQRCNSQQAIVQAQINRFEPLNEAHFGEEFKEYKARLNRIYPLCSSCEKFVERKLKLEKEVAGFNEVQISRTSLARTPSLRSTEHLPSSLKHFSETDGMAAGRSCTDRRRRRHRAMLFNCGPISNCLNLLTFFTSCTLFIIHSLQLQNETDTDISLLDLSQLLPGYVLSSWIPFIMVHTSKITLLGLGSHITSVILMRARRSLPDIVAFFIWCALSLLNSSEGHKLELCLSELSFSSILCIVSFAVAFLPRKLLHRKRPNNIIQSAFSIASTPISQCSTLSAHTSPGRGVSFCENAASREATPSRELGRLLNSLSLGSDRTPPQKTPVTRQRRGPFDSMKKPVLAEPRLRLPDSRNTSDGNTHSVATLRYVKSFAPSSMTSVSTVRDPWKFTLFNVICMLGIFLSVALNAAMFCKLFYSGKT